MLRKPLLAIILFHLLLYVVVILNIPVIRQIIVFIYLTFIPGFILLKFLKLTNTMIVEKILFAVGLSLAFLMIIGLLINEIFFAVGISTPLLSTPLLITLSALTLVMSIVAFRQDLAWNFKLNENSFNLRNALPKSILILPFIFGVAGSLYANVYILSLMIISLVILYVLSVFSNRFSSIGSLSFLLFIVSLTITIQVMLTSRYIIGWDANTEFYVFKLAANSGHWSLLSNLSDSNAAINYSSMISITILPTIYYSLMNTSGEVVFKSLYPLVFSLVPVVLFTLYSKQIGKRASVLSALFFVSGTTVFYGLEPLSLNRQIIGTLFLALSILIILDKSMPIGKRRFFLIFFGGAMIISHYSLTLLYMFFVLILFILFKIRKYRDNILDSKYVLLLFVMAVSWYAYTSSILVSASRAIEYMFTSFFYDFDNIATRVGPVAGSHPALGSNIHYAGNINYTFLILANLFIIIGIFGLLVKSKKWSIDPKYKIMCFVSGVILVLCLVIPNLAPSLNFTRFYAITILILSSCFVLGGEVVVDFFEALWKRMTNKRISVDIKKITKILLCIVLVGYFLSQSGFVNIVAGAVPLSYSLDYARASTSPDESIQINLSLVYLPKQDVFSANWLLNHKVTTPDVFCSAECKVLISYGLIPANLLLQIENTTIPPRGSFIYLGSLNIMDGIINSPCGSFNTSDISSTLNQNDLIYSNGNNEILYAPVLP
jgi:uncharacterized membrane protein